MPTPSRDPEALKAKLKAWREEGGLNITWNGRDGYGEGRKEFHDKPSKFAREKEAIRELKEAGIQFDRPAK